MKILLEGKRIFEEETHDRIRYFVFSEENMQKNVYLSGYVVKKGEFNQPKKWICADDLPKEEKILPVKDFNPSSYDCFIVNDWTIGEDIQKVLKPFHIDINNDMAEFLKLDSIPEKAVQELKSFFEVEEYYMNYPKNFDFCESYDYEYEGQKERILVDPEDNLGMDITYDQTDCFFRKYIVEAYSKKTDSQTHYVFKTDWDEWYRYSPGDTGENYWLMEEIYEEDLETFPLDQYTRMEIEERDIPEKEEFDFSVYFAPETEYDFYFSKKMFLRAYGLNDGKISTANINGQRVWYTEMVKEGDEITSNWDDMKHLGRTTYGEANVRNEQLTREEMLVYLFGERHGVGAK